MTSEARYFEMLSAAIGEIETDSFEARGGVYDRLWRIVVQQLQAERNDSDEAIATERAAFMAAVQRIEFGERLTTAAEGREGASAAVRGGQSQTNHTRNRSKRSVLGRIILRLAGACAVLLIVGFVYLVSVVRLDSASTERWAADDTSKSWQSRVMRAVLAFSNLIEERLTAPAGARQRAVLYEESATTATGKAFAGNAVWRDHLDATVAAPSAVLSVEVEIPQKALVFNLSLRRAPESRDVISHFIELKFTNPNGQLSDAVEDVLGILMKNDELSAGIELVGGVARIQKGLFLMGLSGTHADVSRNMTLLKNRPWLDVAIVMQDSSRNILAIEKGSTGQTAVNRVLASWEKT
jgi:hypothetical protein